MANLISAQDLIDGARAQAALMREAVATGAPSAKVELPVATFRQLADMIDRLAEVCENSQSAVYPDCFAAPIDGIRWWVPKPEFDRLRSELDNLRTSSTGTDMDLWLCRMTAS